MYIILCSIYSKVSFSQSTALAHYSGQFYSPAEFPGKNNNNMYVYSPNCLCYCFLAPFAAPQPLRLLKTDWCSVELVAGYSHDLSVNHGRPTSGCYHTILHWYGSDGSDGTHAKLDIRKLIRKSAKDVSTMDAVRLCLLLLSY